MSDLDGTLLGWTVIEWMNYPWDSIRCPEPELVDSGR